MSAGDTLVLDVSSDPSLLSTARLFAATAARIAGCDDGVVADVRVAVSEACTRAIRGADGDAGSVRILAEVTDGGFTVTVEGPDGPAAPDDLPGVDLLGSLFPGAERRIDHARATVRFTAPLS